MKNKISEITKAIAQIKGNQFVSLVYLSKSAGELSRFTVNLGFSYHTAVEKSVTELSILMDEIVDKTSLQYQAATEIMASLKETLEKHKTGEQNSAFTKKNLYIPIVNGLSLNPNDSSLQLYGLVNSKVVLKEGTHKTVKSAPLTIEKNKIRKKLTVSKMREFALDKENIGTVKINGSVIEIEPENYSFEVNPPTPAVAVFA